MEIIANYFKGMLEELPHLLDTTKPVVFFQEGYFRISSTVTTTWFIMLMIVIFVLIITSKLEKIPTTRRQSIAEWITMFIYDFVYSICGEKTKKLYGTFGGIFITILVMNFIWVIPIFTTPTASYSTTLALALIGNSYVQFAIIREKNIFGYLKGYFEPNAFMIIGNVIGIFAVPLSLSMRLFGNMFSGKILDSIVMIALPFLVPIVFSLLSILSAIIQAYVFTLLLTMFTGEGIE
ncbi:MAG: F-type H+-transporting ATPase subunit a [Fusobacteria bacterium]|nr:MAG: F-type H+-transporting ATPase subunit a [Fusobacteriota bacterium]KAF0229796.1 MAG: F-type H+-transporting ATPase subunit [Fusobacteriota bacterium]